MAGKARTVITLNEDHETHEIVAKHQYFILMDMINTAHAHNRDILVISITGQFRSGKSFLLNLLYTYLDYLYQNDDSDDGWEKKKETPIKGLKWASGQKTVTNGITMLMYPKPIKGKGVLLMDCQGTGDINMSSTTLDNHILFLGLQLSDVLILNVTGQLTSTDLDRLKVCTDYADGASKGAIFEHLVFLIRNWESENQPMTIEEMYKEARTAQTKKCAEGITNAFKDVKVIGIDSPGQRFGRKSVADNIKFQDVDEEFLIEAKKFFGSLRDRLSQKTKFTGRLLLEEFRILCARPIERIRTPHDDFEEMAVRKVFDMAKSSLEKRLQKLLSADNKKSKTEMEQEIAREFAEVLEKSFLSDCRVQDYASPSQKREFEECLKEVRDTFLTKYRERAEMKAVEKEQERQKNQEFERESAATAQRSRVDNLGEREQTDGNLLISLHAARFLRLLGFGFKKTANSRIQSFVDTSLDFEEGEMEAVETVQVKAKYDHMGESLEELTFRKGDLIEMLREVDEQWAFGTVNGDVGFFRQALCERMGENLPSYPVLTDPAFFSSQWKTASSVISSHYTQ